MLLGTIFLSFRSWKLMLVFCISMVVWTCRLECFSVTAFVASSPRDFHSDVSLLKTRTTPQTVPMPLLITTSTKIRRRLGRPDRLKQPIKLSADQHSSYDLSYEREQLMQIPSRTDDDEEELIQEWRKNDTTGVYDALDQLEKAILLENPDLKLQFIELQEKLDCIDNSRYLLFSTMIQQFIMPLVYAFGLYKLSNRSWIGQSIVRIMDMHFWMFVVAAPLIVLPWKRYYKHKESIPIELSRLDKEHLEIVNAYLNVDWEDPEQSCRDYVLVLLEYWASAVKGMAFVPIFKILLHRFFANDLLQPKPVLSLWMSCCQMLTRIAAIASLYHFPEMMFQLQRKEQPRPIGFFPSLMQTLTKCMLYLAPIGLVSDFSKILMALPTGTIYPLYASILVFIIGTWTRLLEIPSEEPGVLHEWKPTNKWKTKVAYAYTYLFLWRKQLSSIGSFVSKRSAKFVLDILSVTERRFYVFRVSILIWLMFMPLVGPIIHLKAIGKTVRIMYRNDLPDMQAFSNEILDSSSDDMDWMFYLSWREPQRLQKSKRQILENFRHWYFEEGTIDNRYEKIKDKIADEAMRFGNTMEDRMKKELEEDPEAFSRHPPGTWRERAKQLKAKQHEKMYKLGDFYDPLGMALNRGFGIGIGFGTKDIELKEGERPTPRLLQRLAGKCAMKRYNQIHDSEIEEAKADAHFDRDMREQRKKERKERNQKELDYLAKRLQELVPTSDDPRLYDYDEDDGGLKVYGKITYEKISENEWIVVKEYPDDSITSALERQRLEREKEIEGKIEMSPTVKNILNGTDSSGDDVVVESNSKKNDDDLDDWEPSIVYV